METKRIKESIFYPLVSPFPMREALLEKGIPHSIVSSEKGRKYIKLTRERGQPKYIFHLEWDFVTKEFTVEVYQVPLKLHDTVFTDEMPCDWDDC